MVGDPPGGGDRRRRLGGRDRRRRRRPAAVPGRGDRQARRQRLGRFRGDAEVPRALRRRRDRRPRRRRPEEADADERHRPPAGARDLPRRPARRERAVRSAGLPGHRRPRGDPRRLRPGDVHQRGGGALQRGDPSADPVAQGRFAAGAAGGAQPVPEDGAGPGHGPAGPFRRQCPVRLLDRLRPDEARRAAEVEVRLPVPERPRGPDLDPPAAGRLRVGADATRSA